MHSKQAKYERGSVSMTSGYGGSDEVYTNVLLDSGSDRSYITSSLVKKINPVFVQSGLYAGPALL